MIVVALRDVGQGAKDRTMVLSVNIHEKALLLAVVWGTNMLILRLSSVLGMFGSFAVIAEATDMRI